MYIDSKTSSIQLEEGEVFIEERQDENNVFRISTVLLNNGCQVKVARHFSQIGPVVYKPDGGRLDTHLNRETYTVVPTDVQQM